ncbi:DUF1381 domain-containing protein [Staphylococcus nepalensis]|uniref:DUF1381 domain-containing protein n=1 Tax=Staphylococcus nepalensis TaxID=214473 RepID=UPI003016AB4F
MTQYLVRTLTDSTGHTFIHVTQTRENETFVVVDAESAEEAKERVKNKKQCPRCESWNTDYEKYISFLCHNCDGTYLDILRKDSE